MCVSDWRVARLVKSRLIAAVVPPQTTFTLPTNPLRVGVTISATPSTANITISVVDRDLSVVLQETFTPFLFFHYTVKEYGDLPTLRFIVTGDGVIANITVIEYYLPADALLIDPRVLVAK